MSTETARKVVEWSLNQAEMSTVDFTGGSPEMNPNYRWMVQAYREAGWNVLTRCNPTILEYQGTKNAPENYDWVPQFYADHQVEVVASLPCYLEENVNKQRGRHAYQDSIDGLLRLNAVGYAIDPRLRLNLVFNPVGHVLPPPQASLEKDYKTHLRSAFGLAFNELWTMSNMPIKRWRHELERDGDLESYMTTLIDAYNAHTVDALMCRHQISISPTGKVYDCDFNQALELSTPDLDSKYLWELDADDLIGRPIATGDHCYGCTAGAGSSCSGALA